jgi:hypothetical protein
MTEVTDAYDGTFLAGYATPLSLESNFEQFDSPPEIQDLVPFSVPTSEEMQLRKEYDSIREKMVSMQQEVERLKKENKKYKSGFFTLAQTLCDKANFHKRKRGDTEEPIKPEDYEENPIALILEFEDEIERRKEKYEKKDQNHNPPAQVTVQEGKKGSVTWSRKETKTTKVITEETVTGETKEVKKFLAQIEALGKPFVSFFPSKPPTSDTSSGGETDSLPVFGEFAS